MSTSGRNGLRPVSAAEADGAQSSPIAAVLTVAEVAQLLRVPSSWVYEHKSVIPHIKLGKYLRFRRSEIEAWLAELARNDGSLERPTQYRYTQNRRASRAGQERR